MVVWTRQRAAHLLLILGLFFLILGLFFLILAFEQFFRGEGRCAQDCTANCPQSSPVPVQFHYLHQQFPGWDGNGCSLPKEDWPAEFQDPPTVPEFMELRL